MQVLHFRMCAMLLNAEPLRARSSLAKPRLKPNIKYFSVQGLGFRV